MYKPGNVSAAPPVLTPHQARLDWQMWFAALGTHTQAPWFTNLLYRLLQGKRDGMLSIFYILCPIISIFTSRWTLELSYFLKCTKDASPFERCWWRFVISMLREKISANLVSCVPVIELIQTDVSQYPFHQQPPAYLRAHRYRYWFTEAKADGSVLSLCTYLR